MRRSLSIWRTAFAGAALLFLVAIVASVPASAAYCLSIRCEVDPYPDDGGGGGTGGTNSSLLSVVVTSPNPGSTVDGTFTVNADPKGVKNQQVNRVEFFVDNNLVAIDYDNPWRASVNTLAPGSVIYDGSHSLTAMAYTTEGRAVSGPVSVNVANTTGTKYRAGWTSTAIPQTQDFDPAAPSQDVYPVDVTVTNTSTYTWSPTYVKLYYRWYGPDPGAAPINGAPVSLGTSLAPNVARTLRVNVLPPSLANGVSRAKYRLEFDLYDSATAAWFAARGNRPHENPIIVNKEIVAQALGLERFYHYQGDEVGAGMSHLVNAASGNSLLRWTPWASPGRGLSTVLDLTYNAMEKKSDSPVGNNWSISISSLTRFGLPLDVHPNKADEIAGRANRWIEFTDGDGTPHRFVGNQAVDGTVYWEEPAGVHLYLRTYSTTDLTRKWALTRPDGVTFFFDSEGYPTSVQDKNGNRITFGLAVVPPADDPGGPKKRIIWVTDPAGRSYAVDYYTKDEAKKPQIRGKIESISDHEGRKLFFDYYEDGNLLRILQVGGMRADGQTVPDRELIFTYTVPNGSGPAIPLELDRRDPDPRTPSQSTRLYSVRDPRGKETIFSYHLPANANDWKLATRTDRVGQTSRFDYDITNRVTTFTAPLSRISRYGYDTEGKVVSITSPKGEQTLVEWTDRHVTKVTAPNGTTRRYAYNTNGYLTDEWDELSNRTALTYQNVAVDANDVAGKWKAGRAIPHISRLATKTSPRGTATATVGDFEWTFGYDASGNLTTVRDPLGNVTTHRFNANGTIYETLDAEGRLTKFQYDLNGLVSRYERGNGSVTQFGYDRDGLLLWVQDPNHLNDAGADTRAYRIYLDYDAFRRLWRQSAPKSTALLRGTLIWSAADYDPNDNLIRTVDPQEGTSWSGVGWQTGVTDFTYDAMDRQIEIRGAHSSEDPQDERTKLVYDAAGRLVKVTLPEGVKSATVNDWTVDYTYDVLDRVVTSTRYPLDGSTAGARRTHFCYDLAGERRWVTAPKAGLTSAPTACSTPGATPPSYTRRYEFDAAHRQTANVDPEGRRTTSAYDADDNRISETDPRGITKRSEYDALDRATKLIQPYKTGKDLVTINEYDKVGNLVREISPRAFDAAGGVPPFTQFVRRYEYDGADQVVKVIEPTSTQHPEQHYIHYRYDPNGNVLWSSLPVQQSDASLVPADQKTEFTYFDPSWVRTSKDPGKPRIRFDYTAQGWQKERVFESTTAKTISWTYFVDGLRKTQTDPKGQPTKYSYDANNNLTEVDDSAGSSVPGEQRILIRSTYNGFGEIAKVRQQKDGVGNWKATLFTYDPNGSISERTDNREEDDAGNVVAGKAGRRHVFTYNQADWLTTHEDFGTDAGCTDDRKTQTSYLDSGWQSARAVSRKTSACVYETKQTTDWTYYSNRKIQTLITKSRQNGSLAQIESHDILYEAGTIYVGSKTKDTFTRGESGKPCGQGSPCTHTWEYDARGRLVKWSKGAKSSSYTLDPAGNITKEVTGTGTLDFLYSANQLTEVKAGGVSVEKWWYEDGNVDCVTAPSGSKANCGSPGGPVLRDYGFDHLDRLERFRAYANGSETDSADYFYDALDRLGRETEKHPSGSRTVNFDYVGVTSQLSEERHSSASGSYENRTKSYSFDAWGRLTGMQDDKTSGKTNYDFGTDDHGSVSLLLNDAGGAKATYGYEPYGELDDDESDGDDGVTSKTDPLNPFRYAGNRYDSGSGDLQLGNRQFSPSVNRFLTQDTYMGALDDLALSFDPLTMNRYTLTGGNPVSFVEIDGHFGFDDITDAVSDAADFVVDHAHTALDACGLVPVAGSVCDVANAGIYAAEGDWGNAALSAVGAVPIVGEAATVAKFGLKYGDEAIGAAGLLAKRGDDVVDTARTAARSGDDAVQFSRKPVRWEPDDFDRTLLSKAELKRIGRRGDQKRLRELADDPKVSRADRGWVRQEINSGRGYIRRPPGKQLAHRRGYEASKGYDYRYSDLQDISLHKTQTRLERNWLRNSLYFRRTYWRYARLR